MTHAIDPGNVRSRSFRTYRTGALSALALLLFAPALAFAASTAARKQVSVQAAAPSADARLAAELSARGEVPEGAEPGRTVQSAQVGLEAPARLPGEAAPPKGVSMLRPAGSGSWNSGALRPMAVTAGADVTSVRPNVTLPAVVGTTITWQAISQGGTTPYQYKWWRYSNATGAWTMVKDYSTSDIFTWTPTLAEVGTYEIQVWVKSTGSPLDLEDWLGTGSFQIKSDAPTITSFTANTTFPKVFGPAITWTATATGGVAPLQYRFYRYSAATGTWAIVRDYSTSNTYTWTPTAVDMGTYAMQVWVLNANSVARYDAWIGTANFNIIGPTPTITTLVSAPAVPSPAGVPLVFTATATGGVPPLQYQFLRYYANGGTWTTVQNYSTSNTFAWTPLPGQESAYKIQVWVRNAGSPQVFDNWKETLPFIITPAVPLSIASITVTPSLPKPAGTVVSWTATIAGGVAPIQYRFYRYKAGAWSIVQDYSASNTYTWSSVVGDVGSYQIQIWAKNSGSANSYDAFQSTAAFNLVSSQADVVRFLEQATFGPTDAQINYVQAVGYDQWINDQFNLPMYPYPALPLQNTTVPVTCDQNCQRDNYSMYPLQTHFFQNALYGNDQLRQRVAFALHRLIPISGADINQPSWMSPYLQLLYGNAFGNYRTILSAITLNPSMGQYLNMNTSTKGNPNENYAREILQLFSIGTALLNQDGTPQLDVNGIPKPSYDQTTITQFAKVFTGWNFYQQVAPNVPNYVSDMVYTQSNHDTTSKTLLNGHVVPAGQAADLDLVNAIDNVFSHANVGPYVSSFLIRQLVTSNPSPAYVGRVAAVFNNNGSGVRGDLKAVVKAILLDTEARTIPTVTDVNYGHQKDPVLFALNLLRAFNAKSADGTVASDGYLVPQTQSMNMDLFKPPTVFSYYPADFVVPGTTTELGPELAIFSALTSLRRTNFVNTMVFANIPIATGTTPNGTSIDLSSLVALAGDSARLTDEVNRLLLHNSMSTSMRNAIILAVNAVPSSNPLLRARQALYLVASSSQYQVQR